MATASDFPERREDKENSSEGRRPLSKKQNSESKSARQQRRGGQQLRNRYNPPKDYCRRDDGRDYYLPQAGHQNSYPPVYYQTDQYSNWQQRNDAAMNLRGGYGERTRRGRSDAESGPFTVSQDGRHDDQSDSLRWQGGHHGGGKGGGQNRGRGRARGSHGKYNQSSMPSSRNQELNRKFSEDEHREYTGKSSSFNHRDSPVESALQRRKYSDQDTSGRTSHAHYQSESWKDLERFESHIKGGTHWKDNQGRTRQDRGQQDGTQAGHVYEDGHGEGVLRNRSGSNPNQRNDRHNNKGKHNAGKPVCKGQMLPKTSQSFGNESQTGSLIEQLTAGTYECPVCCDRIRSEARVWSCRTCYVVFHLGCIKKWAKSPAATAEGTDGWQCPACRGVEIKIPYVYQCFCGKLRDPPWEPGETPHSCGEVCRRKRPTTCPHPCNILCHPGPCPPCPTNVQKHCQCGKTNQTVRCGTQNEIRCQTECGKRLNCGVHFCQKVCHSGPCDACEEVIVQGCYCGHASRNVVCTEETVSGNTSGMYSCHTVCGRLLDCGHHTCEDRCHSGPCDPCRFDPSRVTTCPCGQTLLALLGGTERNSCTDPIPTCHKKCNTAFPCGGKEMHRCEQTCHSGLCPPCESTSMIKCRCGHRFVDVSCKELIDAVKSGGGVAPPVCDRKCTRKKQCGRHKCNQLCCIDTEHFCHQLCGRKLKCGLHTCEEVCHVGNCPPCLHSSFDELTCHCGTEVLFPPIPCGTGPPDCHQPCNRRHDCEHQVRHLCHSEEKCPLCVELTSKTCIGGHEVRYNIPCHIQQISCGRQCGKPLPCGYHMCLKTCHEGDCDPECKQPCKVPRVDCDHPCSVTCHVGWPCPQIACKSKITVKCPCGRRNQVMECQAGSSDTSMNQAFQRMTTSTLAGKIQTLQHGQDVDISELTRNGRKANRLQCDENCAIQERNSRVALALQIKNPELTHAKTTNYSDFLKEQARKHSGLVAAIEKELSALVISAQKSKQPGRSHAFPPMTRNHRRIIHELSEFYGCESESYDDEPKRNVVTTARRNKCFMPAMTLTAVIQRELHPKAPLPIPHASQEEEIRSASKASKLTTDVVSTGSRPTSSRPTNKQEKTVIDYFDMTD